MKIGGFGFIKDYLHISEAGYDFAELDIPEIEKLSEEAFEELKHTVRTGVPVLTGARLLPVSEPLFFTEGYDPESLRTYLEKACERTAQLGIKAVILGNGKARWLQSETDREKEDIFIKSLRLMAQTAEKNGQKLILEPLGPKYSNYINTVAQAVQLIKKVDAPNLHTMADLRHMVWAEEPFRDIEEYLPYIHHIHIDYPLSYPERRYPSAEDDYDYSAFLNSLKQAGYQGTLTIEADIPADWNQAYRQAMGVIL